ncbi:MAG: hypothetical protein KAI83_14475 [Thiomargarita sp.]|nr:hypothetical protein [Thiomargarita sp.]
MAFGVQRFGFLSSTGNHKELPLHQNLLVTRHKNIIVGAILYGCPE